MTVTTTILTALLAVQAGAPNQEPAARDASAVTPRIEIPEETTDTTTQPIAESTWQNTEIELLVQKARESLQEDRYPEALDLYIAASDRRPLDERLQYNLGVAAYRAGALDVATRAFERASAGDDPKITQSALFNRGNVSYRRALDLVEDARDTQSRERASEGQADPQTLEQPIDALKQALSHYRDAIIASPDSRDARRNAELAHRLMKALEETQEEQQQEQDQQEQDQQEPGPAGTGPAGTGPAEPGPAGTGPAGTGPAGTGPAGTGPAGTGPAEPGPAEPGPAEPGPAEPGPAGTGPAGTGPAGTGPAGTGPAGTGPAGTGPAGTGSAGTGSAGTGSAGTGSAGTGSAEPGPAGTEGIRCQVRRRFREQGGCTGAYDS